MAKLHEIEVNTIDLHPGYKGEGIITATAESFVRVWCASECFDDVVWALDRAGCTIPVNSIKARAKRYRQRGVYLKPLAFEGFGGVARWSNLQTLASSLS